MIFLRKPVPTFRDHAQRTLPGPASARAGPACQRVDPIAYPGSTFRPRTGLHARETSEPFVQTNQLANVPAGSFTGTLVGLFQKGLRYSTVIDVGCADGHFYVYHYRLGLFPGSTALNIDPNPIYEDSLKAIKEVMGGHYAVAAASDNEGEVELTLSAHPYWSSLLPREDSYWERINHLARGAVKVPAVTLDGLVARLGLSGPYLVKLDVQGAEAQVLRGARELLAQTHVVICEADMDDFQVIHKTLVDAEFRLFDVTQPVWLTDRSLGWFYPVYLHRSLGHLGARAFWDEAQNAAAVKGQADRRGQIRKLLGEMLAEQRAARTKG
jgi:FkbM family methyltransferase